MELMSGVVFAIFVSDTQVLGADNGVIRDDIQGRRSEEIRMDIG
jgi:hypothetical protein